MRQAIRLAIGCAALALGGPAVGQPPRGPADFPLANGMKWVYTTGDTEAVMTVTGVERFNGEECFRVETVIGDTARSTELYAVRADGVYRTRAGDDAVLPALKVIPNPAKLGHTWAVDCKVGTKAVKGTMAVVGEDERVSVPAGEFDTVVVEGKDVEFPGGKMTVRSWFAKNRGIVQQEFVVRGLKVRFQLSRFECGEWSPPDPAPERPAASAWAFPQPYRILPRCTLVSITTQESSGCCARPVRCWGRRR